MSTNSRTSTKRAKAKTSVHKKPKLWRNAFGQVEVSAQHPDAHNYQPVRGCECKCCWVQRAAFRRRMADHVLSRLWDARYPHGGGRVRVGANATAEFIDIMTGGIQ